MLLLVAFSLALLGGCSKPTTESNTPPAPVAVQTPAAAEPSEAAADAEDLEPQLQTVGSKAVHSQVHAPGQVLENAYGTTLITPRVAALVIRRYGRLGDQVAAGAPLVTLSSPDVADAQANLQLAEQEWQRMQALGRDLVSGRRYGEAQIAVKQARAKASAFGLTGKATTRANGEFTLTAPHAGRLTADDFIVGQQIEPGHALFRLVDESVLWVDAKLPSGLPSQVPVGTPAIVVFGDLRAPGKVLLSGHRTETDARTPLVRVELPNDQQRLHAGDLVEVLIELDGAQPQLLVPSVALTLLRGQTVAFRVGADGELEPVPVETGAVVDGDTVIQTGLQPGDRIAVSDVYELKSRLLRSELGDDD